MRKILYMCILLLCFALSMIVGKAYYSSCFEYGIGAKSNFDGTCSCSSGYMFTTDMFGKETCTSIDSYCSDLYGYQARYNSLSKKCECGYGYTLGLNAYGKTQCISEDESCQNEFGDGAKASYTSGKCTCRYGYVWGKDTFGNDVCMTESLACGKYGFHAKSDNNGKCVCEEGYIFSTSYNPTCISYEEYCKDKFGIDSIYNILDDRCACRSGYEWNLSNTSCIKKKEKCGLNSSPTGDGECSCNDGYTWEEPNDSKNFDCIRKISFYEQCQQQYGTNVYGDEKNCYCNTGYVWNLGKTACVQQNTTNLSEKEKRRIDGIFEKLKSTLSKLDTNDKIAQYRLLIGKIDTFTKKQTTQEIKSMLLYVKTLIEKEIESLKSGEEDLGDLDDLFGDLLDDKK